MVHPFLDLGSWISRCDLLMMSEVPIDNTASSKQNEFGPNYFAYYKHLVLDLFSQNGDVSLPFTDGAVSIGNSSGGEAEGSHTDDKGRRINYCHDSSSYFTEAVGEGLSEFKRERLLATLNESAACFNREADEVLEQILAAFQIDSSLRETGQFPNHWNSVLDKDLSMPFNNKKRKAHSSHSNYSGGNSTSVRQVYNSIQALQGKDEICHEDVENYTFQFLAKIDKMEENLEEYMNIVMSKCRPMTRIEKHQLGKKIRKLPEKALDRVVEILQPSNLSTKDLPESIFVNLEEQDNVKLWRLYYYVELVARANN